MLSVDDTDENLILVRQLENLDVDQKKSKAVDDAVDALRYCVTSIPWDWTILNMSPEAVAEKTLTEAEKRRKEYLDAENHKADMQSVLEAEIEEWNEYYSV
jgi:hypothetical protein